MILDTNTSIIKTSLALAVGTFFGWHVFSALSELFPQIGNLDPIIRLAVGLGGIWLMVRIGLRKQ